MGVSPFACMEYDFKTTAVAFIIFAVLLAGGTLTSPMPTALSIGITVALVVFGLLMLFLGVKHGEYRAS